MGLGDTGLVEAEVRGSVKGKTGEEEARVGSGDKRADMFQALKGTDGCRWFPPGEAVCRRLIKHFFSRTYDLVQRST